MNKKTKIKLLEYIILSVIIISIIVIFLVLNISLNKTPEISNTNEIKDYTITKYYKFNISLSNANIYKIPLYNMIQLESSEFTRYITATDDYITTLNEKIKINYVNVPTENQNILINYCNAYDEIENTHIMKCQKNKEYLILENIYYLNKIYTKSINTEKGEITLPISKETKASEYLKTLIDQVIIYQEVSEIN